MRIPPPEVRASWPPANYDDPIRRGPGVLIVQCIAAPITLACVALRLYYRTRLLRRTGWDDWLMVAATISGLGVSISVILASTLYGWDRHVWDLPSETVVQGRQISLATQTLFLWATNLAKLSILVSYLDLIAPLGQSLFRTATRLTIGFIVLVNSGMFVLIFVQCRPISSYWTLTSAPQDCTDEGPPLMAQSIMTVITDFIVWVLPLPIFLRAHLPLRQRLALLVLFSFGLFVVVAACIRTYWIHYVVDKTYDPTWEGLHLWMWTAVEVNLGLICGCVPWLKGLAKYWWTGVKPGQPSRPSKGSGNGGGVAYGGVGAGAEDRVFTGGDVGLGYSVSVRSPRPGEAGHIEPGHNGSGHQRGRSDPGDIPRLARRETIGGTPMSGIKLKRLSSVSSLDKDEMGMVGPVQPWSSTGTPDNGGGNGSPRWTEGA